MEIKPKRASDYKSEQVELVRSTCLYIATKLGDLMDKIVVVGGLVPSLLIDHTVLPEGAAMHVGTLDLDVGMTLAIFDREWYRTLAERLRNAGFTPDRNEKGRLIRQRWRIEGHGPVTVDFLIPPSSESDEGGTLRNLEKDFAAIIVPGLDLAFRDRRRVRIVGKTIFDEKATREIWVCGPGAFVVLKALAVKLRGENKDAYDLYYLIRNFGKGLEDVVTCLKPLLDHSLALEAIETLRNDFLEHDGLGPRRVAEFLHGGPDVAIQADVSGFIRSLLQRLDFVT